MSRFLTGHFPGTGGTIRETPEDFEVEEVPLYQPCGEGEHLYLTVEKRGMTTHELLHRLSRTLGVRERDLGYAGLKDARALTRQTVSVPGLAPEQATDLDIEGVRLIEARRHRNKLRPGHLAGNRFRIRLRKVGNGALENAQNVLHILDDLGVPNYFGAQRYGSLANSHRIGRALLQRDFSAAAASLIGDPAQIRNDRWRQAATHYAAGQTAAALETLPPRMRNERRLLHALVAGKSHEQAVLSLPRKLLRLFLSAYQAELFDRQVTMRIDSLEVLWPGDLAWKHENGACFRVADPAAEQPRADRFEISPSGVLFGHKAALADAQAGLLEHGLLDKEGISLKAFRLPGGLSMEGGRRPLRVPLRDARAAGEGEDLVLSFALPKGSYATSVLREVMKTEAVGTLESA